MAGMRVADEDDLPKNRCQKPLVDDIIPLSRHEQFIGPGVSQAPLITELNRCWQILSDQRVTKGPNGLIPEQPVDLWKAGGGRSRQRAINAFLTDTSARDFLRATPLRDQQRLVSASAKRASAWLTSIPSSPELAINDADFIFAVRHRLGLPCAEGLPQVCTCEEPLDDDAAHFQSCIDQRRTSVTARHDFVVRALAALFRHVEAWVHIEPRIYRVERLRPDLEVTFPDQTLLIDVAIAHPAAPSRSSVLPLAATAGPEREKIKKYKALAHSQGSTFL